MNQNLIRYIHNNKKKKKKTIIVNNVLLPGLHSAFEVTPFMSKITTMLSIRFPIWKQIAHIVANMVYLGACQ